MTPRGPNPWPSRPDRRTGRAVRRLAALLLAGLAAAAGCKGKDGGSPSRPDPLRHGTAGLIPKQNVPLPERGTAGGRVKPDPLISSPTSRPADRTGAGYSQDPERWKGSPYVPDIGGVPASLATRTGRDADELRIDSGTGVPLRSAGGGSAADLAAGAELDRLLAELRNQGVGRGDYDFTRGDNGKVVFTARVPNAATGAFRQFTAEGATNAEAVQQVIDQVKAERK